MGSEEAIRLPDHFNDPTAATVLRSEYTISSDASGNALWAETPNFTQSRSQWTITAGAAAAVATFTAHPQASAFYADARVARVIAIKVQLTYIGAAQTTSGYLSYSTKADWADVDSKTLDAIHTGSHCQARADVPLSIQGDYTQEPRWESPSDGTFGRFTHKLHVFAATGLPVSTAVFRVRVLRFVEFLPLEGSLSEGDLKHEPHDPAALSAHGALSGPMTSIQRGAPGGFLSTVKEVANAAYHMAQPLMPYVVPKARKFLQGAFQTALPLMLGV